MSAGADAPGGRTAELLKVAASGRGVVTSSGAWTWSSGERGRRLSGVERRVVSDNAATDGGRWRSARSDDASRGECWRVGGRVQAVVGETRRTFCVVKRSCCIVDGVVVVVVVEERRFARAQ